MNETENFEFRQFLSIAKGSAGETRLKLYRVYENKYIRDAVLEKMTNNYEVLSKKIAAFINYLNEKDYKGIKYK